MSLGRAQNIFISANINSIVILTANILQNCRLLANNQLPNADSEHTGYSMNVVSSIYLSTNPADWTIFMDPEESYG